QRPTVGLLQDVLRERALDLVAVGAPRRVAVGGAAVPGDLDVVAADLRLVLHPVGARARTDEADLAVLQPEQHAGADQVAVVPADHELLRLVPAKFSKTVD